MVVSHHVFFLKKNISKHDIFLAVTKYDLFWF
jgi:hypothetical protein